VSSSIPTSEEKEAAKEINLSQEQIKKMRDILKEDLAWKQSGQRDSSTYVLKSENLKK
jgi:hypothetical protein